MSLNLTGILAAVTSHASASGLFDRVNTHEPKSAPGNGITCGVWLEKISPAAGQSSLIETSALVVLSVRLYIPMVREPQDSIDSDLAGAVDALLAAYSGDFELGGTVRNVDLLGALGTPLGGQAGYVNQDGKLLRVFTITLPLVVNDAWEQTA